MTRRESTGVGENPDDAADAAAKGWNYMALVLYIIALVLTVLLMKVADLIHSSGGDVRIAVFLGILFLVNFILGRVPLSPARRAP